MTAPYTSAEHALAAKLYAEFVGYDLAHRLPLRCQTPWHQAQWCAVARLAIALVGEQQPDPTAADLERFQVVREGFPCGELPSGNCHESYCDHCDGKPPTDPDIPSPPIVATAVLR